MLNLPCLGLWIMHEPQHNLLRSISSRFSKYGRRVHGPLLLIASYPRSGNHLVRFFVEYVTGRATLGCYKNSSDVPIFQGSQLAELHHVSSSDPIGQKAHFSKEIDSLKRLVQLERMLLIQRDPAEAILSHRPRPDGMPMSDYMAQLRLDIEAYNALCDKFRSWPHPKHLVNYERLVGINGAMELDDLIRFIGADYSPRAVYALEHFKELRERFASSEKLGAARPFSDSRHDPNYYKKRADGTLVRLVQTSARPA